jgi:Rrf2 family iron-sulfur cluster assembly transcriptional regulator
MRMSTKGRFAVNAMIDLALREFGGPVALAAIASRQQISLSYLEQLFAKLRGQGLVRSTRGPGGGYTLGREASDISVAEIVGAVEDDAMDGDGVRVDAASARELWAKLDTVMREHMATITLASLAEQQRALGVVIEPKATAPRRAFSPAPVPRPVASRAPNSVFAFGRSFARG